MRLALTPMAAAAMGNRRLSLEQRLAAIYAAGRLGPMFDPSDLSTMFTTRAGSTLVGTPGNGAAHFVGRILDKSGGGYHALAANDTTARPQLSARVNLLTYTEDLSNAAWSKVNTTVTANATTDPFGGSTADKLIANTAAATQHRTDQTPVSVAGSQVLAIYLKAAEYTWASLRVGLVGANFNLATGTVGTAGSGQRTITPVGSGWYLCTLTGTAAANDVARINIETSDTIASLFTGDGTSGIFVWGADLRPTNIHAAGSIPAYQRVVDAETYDSAGFPLRLIPNGTGQSMATSTIAPGTDSVTMGAGVRKLSDAAQAVIMEFGPSTEVAGGNVGLIGPSTAAAATYRARSSGTVVTSCTTGSTFAAPLTSTLRVSADISSDSSDVAVNGTVAATSAADQGTGDYSAQVLNYFQRAGGTLWFGGQYFGSITMFGPQLSASELATVESWLNSRTKAY